EITYLGDQFANIRLYTDWNLGRYAAPRMPQKTDDPDDFLLEDASNLGLVLNDLEHRGSTRQFLTDEFRKFYDTADVISTKVQGGTIQVFVHEKGLSRPVPATRLSDGTLRYLCLLSILCHPNPPPLICLEEPELGLHPDILPTIAELLIDAAQRTQLVVTTHSDILVSALSEIPETVLVCERDESGSHLRRLEADTLKKWLENYSLGELWRMGEIGGTRW
ncbi:MAG TPA: AAA family ATPase, partial [Anaerolineae bacterium]